MKKFEEIKKCIKITIVIGIAFAFILPSTTIGANLAEKNKSDSSNQNDHLGLLLTDERIADSFKLTEKNEIIISYEMQDLMQMQVTTEQGIFTRLEIPGSGFLGELGKPQLPCINNLYAVPTTEVSLEIVEANIAESRNVGKVYPAQKPQIDCDTGENAEFIIDESFYDLDINYPNNLAEIILDGKIRDIPFIRIGFYPVQYNPSEEIVTIYNKITIKITFEETLLPMESDFKHSPFWSYYENVFTNWDEFLENTEIISSHSGGKLEESGCEYLIITHPTFATLAQELEEWKNKRGIITKIVDTTETGDVAEDIMQYIQNAYDTWDPAPSYVLLVGDAEYVPTNYLYIHPYNETYTASDMWYATVSGSDYYPDIFIGRLPVDTTEQANIIVQKIIDYEKTPPTDSQFYSTGAVAAYFQDIQDPPNSYKDGYEDRRFVKTSEEIRDFLLTQGYDVERIYCTKPDVNPTNYNDGYYANGEPLPPELLRPGFAWDGDHNDITNAINQGSIIVNHRDHGGIHVWGDPYYNISHINSLSNGNLLPIVFSINCQTGWFDDEECFSEAFIRKNNGGAVGIVGASRVSYSGLNDFLCRGFYDAIWPDFDLDIGGTLPLYNMGQVLNYGKSYMADTWSNPGAYERVTFEMFHWFGDPTMEIWTDIPQNLVVDHPSEIDDSNAVTVTVYDSYENPIEGALVCISHENNIYGRGLTDSNGVAIFDVNVSTSDMTLPIVEDAAIVVTKHDYIPYESTISVESERLGNLNGDGVVNIIDLFILLRSWGENPSSPADLNGNGVVNLMDILILFANWG